MLKHISNVICALAIGGGLALGVVSGTACDDDDDGGTGVGGSGGRAGTTGTTGAAGRGGTTGTGGTAGTAGAPADGGAPTGDAAGTMTYTVPLSGAAEVPAVATTAVGTATVTLDPASGMVTVTGSYGGFTTPVNNAHIHGPALPGMNAAAIVPLTFDMATSGNLSGSGTLTAAQVQDMLMGRTYVNVHSVAYPMGEIRGQIN